ncbi:MAG: SAM-dependent methyltransferase [Desulfuromonadales bacterium]|nr:SAM-dependent methyltransferase [Desulfuromonadales bacterium]
MVENGGNAALKKYIHDQIESTGGLDFATYMELCLYHPEHGYYMAARDRIGKQGDFFTSSSVHSLFGRLLARQLKQMWDVLGGGAFTIAEQGAGEGHLALDILTAIKEECPQFYARLTYLLVEISPDNRERQQRLLAAHAAQVSWCTFDDVEALVGCYLSNELIDAFPAHLLEKRAGTLQEVFVVDRDGELAEELREVSTPEIAEHFRRLGVAPVEGNRFEVNLAANRWMTQVARKIARGFVLTIDYGYPATELYSPLRSNGTLMCYQRHTSNEEPLLRIGEQDITAHVDFTALQLAGQAAGLEPLWFGEQYRFLMSLGFVEALIELQAKTADEKEARALRLTLKNLIMPDGGMGETFKVLVQGKGVDNPALLCQRKLTDLPLPAML